MRKSITIWVKFASVGGVAALLLVIIFLTKLAQREHGILVSLFVFLSMFPVWFGTLVLVAYSAVRQLNESPGIGSR